MALFASPSSSNRQSSKNLVEFRAGRMRMEGKMVKPDKRKGLVYVHQSDDGLMHFCWKDRTSGKVEDDLIIFPDDCEFKRVPQCTTGRVYILKFKASSRKFFFWMQEPKTDKDDDHCKKVNESLNSPPTPGQSSGNDLPGLDQIGSGNIQDMLSNMDNNQLLQLMAAGGGMGGNLGGLSSLLGAAGGARSRQPRSQATASSARTIPRPATTTAVTSDRAAERPSATPAPVTPSPAAPATPSVAAADSTAQQGLQLSQLQNILSQMGVQGGAAAAAGEEPVDLSKAITSDVMIPILANPEVQERLKPFLPQGESLPPTADELKATVKSPQFRQAMTSFSEALATGQLGPVLKQFGLPESAQEAAAKGDVEGFAKAMQENETTTSSSDGKAKKDEEEDMVVE